MPKITSSFRVKPCVIALPTSLRFTKAACSAIVVGLAFYHIVCLIHLCRFAGAVTSDFPTTPTGSALQTVQYPAYSSEYFTVCMADDTARVTTYTEATAYCEGLGDGWYLGSAPTSEGLAAVLSGCSPGTSAGGVPRSAVFLAGILIRGGGTGSDRWEWTAGRLKGSSFMPDLRNASSCASGIYSRYNFSRYCPWDTRGESSTNAINLIAYRASTGPRLRNSSATPTLSNRVGVVCERSLCSLAMDCAAAATSVTGYFPACKCSCPSGIWGARCQFPIVVSGPITSQYQYVCDGGSTGYSNQDAATAAALLTNGSSAAGSWGLSTIPSLSAMSVIKEAISRSDPTLFAEGVKWFLIDGSDATQSGVWRWRYGRLKDLVFYSGGAAQQYIYRGIGLNATYQFPSGVLAGFPSTSNYLKFDASQPSLQQVNGAATPSHTCYLTERFPCVLAFDCEASNTASVTGGYYPFCVCQCKPNAFGSRCQFPIPVAHSSVFTSHYAFGCKTASSITFRDAQSACQALDSSLAWSLAAVPSASVTDAVLSSFSRHGTSTSNMVLWLGGSDAAVEGEWRWQYGRLANSLFYKVGLGATAYTYAEKTFQYDNFNPTEPNGASAQNYLQWRVKGSNKWNDELASDTTFSGDNCYLCERSPCHATLDCYEPHTTSASGFFPNCVCNCKWDKWGDQCEFPLAVKHDAYTSEYHYFCYLNSSRFVNSTAYGYCLQPRGSNGKAATFLGSIPTEEAQTRLTEHFKQFLLPRQNSSYHFFTAGRLITPGGGEWAWLTGGGRVEGMVFWNGSGTTGNRVAYYDNSFNYSNWYSLEPNRDGGVDEPVAIHRAFDTYDGWHDVPAATQTHCTLCERFPCKVEIDCTAKRNTKSVTGYYPNCVCACEEGFTGDKCQHMVVNHTTTDGIIGYTSHYELICRAEELTWAAANDECSSRSGGNEVWLATVPTNESFTTLSAYDANFNNAISVGGWNSNPAVSKWTWVAGRLAGLAFSDNNVSLSHGFVLFSKRYVFNFAYWHSGEPNNYGGSESIQMTIGGMNDVQPSHTQKCFACERSPCTAEVDCVEPISVSGFWPNCVCTCETGVRWGTYCEFPIIVNHGPNTYTSEYEIHLTNMSYDDAANYCASKSDGTWWLASVPSANAMSNLTYRFHQPSIATTATRFVLGGDCRKNVSEWRWVAGRLRGEVFYVHAGISPTYSRFNFSYTAWASTRPEFSASQYGVLMLPDAAAAIPKVPLGASWHDYTGLAKPDYHTVCERSPCSIPADCPKDGTARVEGYWPNCRCICNPHFWGDTCEHSSIRVDFTTHTTSYDVLCLGSVSKSSDLVNLCRASPRGKRWFQATIPTQTAFDTITTAIAGGFTSTKAGILVGGAKANSATLSWRWDSGRFAGNVFREDTQDVSFTYPSFPSSDSQGVQYSFSGQWDGAVPSASNSGSMVYLFNVSAAPNSWLMRSVQPSEGAKGDCVLCEFSECSVAADCVAANTESVTYSSATDSCLCSCLCGFYGRWCHLSYPAAVHHGSFKSEYEGHCGILSPHVTYAGAKQFCQMKGPEWVLASIPTAAAWNALSKQVTLNSSMYWASANAFAGKERWAWGSGRLENRTFFTGTISSTTTLLAIGAPFNLAPFQAWRRNEPRGGTETVMQIRFDADGGWCDYPATEQTSCVLCERSPCNISLDCVERNTWQVSSSYWPLCTCFCKSRWRGKTCRLAATATAVITESSTILVTASLSHTKSRNTAALSETATADESGTATVVGTRTNTLTASAFPSSSQTAGLSSSHSAVFTDSRLASFSKSLASSATYIVTLTEHVSVSNTHSSSTTLTPSQTATGGTIPDTLTRSATLSASFSHDISVSKLTQSFSLTFALPLLLKPPETPAQKVISGVIVGGAIASPVGGAVSVGMALIRAAKCGDDDGEEADLPMIVHPLRFGVGTVGEIPEHLGVEGMEQWRRHKLIITKQRGAVLGNGLIIPVLVLVLVGGPVSFLVKRITHQPSFLHVFEVVGFPSVGVLPFSVLAEGLATSTVGLLNDGAPLSLFLGFFGLFVMFSVLSMWVWVLFFRLPFRKMAAEDAPMAVARRAGGGLIFADVVYWLKWIVHARKEWVYNGDSVGSNAAADDGDAAANSKEECPTILLDSLPTSSTRFFVESEGDGSPSGMGGYGGGRRKSADPVLGVPLLSHLGSPVANLHSDAPSFHYTTQPYTVPVAAAADNFVTIGDSAGDSQIEAAPQTSTTSMIVTTHTVSSRSSSLHPPRSPTTTFTGGKGERANRTPLQGPHDTTNNTTAIPTSRISEEDALRHANIERFILRASNMIAENRIMASELLCLSFSFLVGALEGIEVSSNDRPGCQARASFMIIFALLQTLLGVMAFIPLEIGFNSAQLALNSVIAIVTIVTLSADGNEDGLTSATPSVPRFGNLLDSLGMAINTMGIAGVLIGVVRAYSQVKVAHERQIRLAALTAEAAPPAIGEEEEDGEADTLEMLAAGIDAGGDADMLFPHENGDEDGATLLTTVQTTTTVTTTITTTTTTTTTKKTAAKGADTANNSPPSAAPRQKKKKKKGVRRANGENSSSEDDDEDNEDDGDGGPYTHRSRVIRFTDPYAHLRTEANRNIRKFIAPQIPDENVLRRREERLGKRRKQLQLQWQSNNHDEAGEEMASFQRLLLRAEEATAAEKTNSTDASSSVDDSSDSSSHHGSGEDKDKANNEGFTDGRGRHKGLSPKKKRLTSSSTAAANGEAFEQISHLVAEVSNGGYFSTLDNNNASSGAFDDVEDDMFQML